jgi:hypothetical protein
MERHVVWEVIHVYKHPHEAVWYQTRLHACMYVCMCVYLCTWNFVCIADVSRSEHLSASIYIFKHMFVCVCLHAHIHTSGASHFGVT